MGEAGVSAALSPSAVPRSLSGSTPPSRVSYAMQAREKCPILPQDNKNIYFVSAPNLNGNRISISQDETISKQGTRICRLLLITVYFYNVEKHRSSKRWIIVALVTETLPSEESHCFLCVFFSSVQSCK